MACPFFMPTRRSEDGAWLHPSRLPLGWSWDGHCTAPGHEGALPESTRVREACNLGYANTCPRLPVQRVWDAVRFAVSQEHESAICLSYVCERNHLPAEYGQLEYNFGAGQWTGTHADPRIQRMAECFLDSWRSKARSTPANTSPHESLHDPA